MKQLYHLDFKKLGLQKFKKSIQKRRLIPSRVILQSEVEERFDILSSNGITNLKELLDALKTKEKIEAFSNTTDLSEEYLVILKREINSFHPNPVKLTKFPEIDTITVQILENYGIRNSKQLFNRANYKSDINRLMKETSVSKNKLDEFVALSDLVRLYGVGPVFARIIYDAGIKSVDSFIKYSAKDFIHIYEDKTRKKADFSEGDIEFSIAMAKELISLKSQ